MPTPTRGIEKADMKAISINALIEKGFTCTQIAKTLEISRSHVSILKKRYEDKQGFPSENYVKLALKVLTTAMKEYTKNTNYRNAVPALNAAKEVLQRRYPLINQTLSISASISPVDLQKYLNKSVLPNP